MARLRSLKLTLCHYHLSHSSLHWSWKFYGSCVPHPSPYSPILYVPSTVLPSAHIGRIYCVSCHTVQAQPRSPGGTTSTHYISTTRRTCDVVSQSRASTCSPDVASGICDGVCANMRGWSLSTLPGASVRCIAGRVLTRLVTHAGETYQLYVVAATYFC